MTNTWFRDRAEGEAAERRLARALRRGGWRALETVGRDAFDLLLVTTVEVKHDRHAPRTGKVAIEVESRGRPSGIMTSPAEYWALVCGEAAIMVRSGALRARTLNGNWQERVCGDDGQAVVRLAPIDEILAIPGTQLISLENEHA
jgi:hypothetical protein